MNKQREKKKLRDKHAPERMPMGHHRFYIPVSFYCKNPYWFKVNASGNG